MKAIERLYRKDELIKISTYVDDDLYEKLQYLSDHVFDATISKLINICIEHALDKGNIKFYKRPKNVESTYRSIVLRKTFRDKLYKMKNTTGIAFTRLVNSSIKEFLNDYRDLLK